MALYPTNWLSCCSGFGGLDLAVKLAMPNARTILYVEREAYCAEGLATRGEQAYLDDAPIWSNLETFRGEPWRGLVDGVVAGIPCQGNSLAGKRLLEKDERNLWPAMRRILSESLAAPIVRILGELAEDGWDAACAAGRLSRRPAR